MHVGWWWCVTLHEWVSGSVVSHLTQATDACIKHGGWWWCVTAWMGIWICSQPSDTSNWCMYKTRRMVVVMCHSAWMGIWICGQPSDTNNWCLFIFLFLNVFLIAFLNSWWWWYQNPSSHLAQAMQVLNTEKMHTKRELFHTFTYFTPSHTYTHTHTLIWPSRLTGR